MSEPIPSTPNESEQSIDVSASNPQSTETQSVSMEGILRENVEITARFGKQVRRGDVHLSVSPLFFRQPDGTPDVDLPGPCDEDNRQMLDSLYRLAHADLTNVTEHVRRDENLDRITKTRIIPTDEGFEFVEQFVDAPDPLKDQRWRNFRVFCRPVGGWDRSKAA